MARKAVTVSEQLRQAIERSGMSRYAICKATGIDKAAMSRFMAGKTGFSTSSVDKLAALLGLELRPTTKRPRPKGR